MNDNAKGWSIRRWSLAASVLLVIVTIAAGLWRVRFGLELMDEGIYLSNPWRYMLGDIPFRDELLSSTRWADILVWQLMKILPGCGNVLTLRYIGIVFHYACFGALLVSLRRHAPPLLLAAAFAAAAHLNTLLIWTPGYQILSADFLYLSLAAWFYAIESPSRAAQIFSGAAAGAALFLAAFCYNTIAPLVVVPAGVFCFSIFSRAASRKNLLFSSLALMIVFFALSAAAVATIHRLGLWPDLARAVADLKAIPSYRNGIATRVFHIIKMSFGSLPFAALSIVCWAAPAAILKRKFSPALAASAPAIFYAVILLPVAFACAAGKDGYVWTLANIGEGTCFASAAVFICVFVLRARRADPRRMSFLTILFFTGVFWNFIVSVSSGMGLLATPFTVPPLLILLVIAAGDNFLIGASAGAEGKRDCSRGVPASAALCLILAVCFTAITFSHTFSDDKLVNLNTRFTRGKLKGVYSTPGRVRDMEELIDYLEPRLEKGEFLYAFHGFPMLYYLTGTRPATDISWSDPVGWPVSVMKRSIDRMVVRGRAPRYAVRLLVAPSCLGKSGCVNSAFTYSTDPAIDPAFAYIHKYYVIEKRFKSFEVWRRL